jgi:penicillin amidase
MRRLALLIVGLVCLASLAPAQEANSAVEVIRDKWGVPHIFADSEPDGFYALGYVTTEDRILQMELFRRRANGRLAELFGKDWVASDRKFRVAGIPRYCAEAAANLPVEARAYLRAYAAGVNAFVRRNPDTVARRFVGLGITPESWTEGDCVCAWMAVGEVFDRLFDEGAINSYHDFRQLAAELGEEEALKQRGIVIDDAAAIVPESEMAKEAEIYERLKSRPPIPGFGFTSFPDEMLRFSHAWAVGGARSVTGKPVLESDPQTSVNNPPLWYEFHLSAGRFDVRGIGVAGSPGMLIGFNRRIAWGVTALGAGSTATFLEKLTAGGQGYQYKERVLPFLRRQEVIRVKGGDPVTQEVLRTRHGFVFDRLAKAVAPGESYVSRYTQLEEKATSILGMLGMMRASSWLEFRQAIEHYYSPGIHVVYADVDNNLGYQTLVHVPLTRRTPRMALEGWTGEDEVMGRVSLDEMPHMLNPDSHFISHANNLPVGSWYPYDIGIGTGGTGHSTRSLRLVQLLAGDKQFSVDSFESDVHRDDVHANVAALFPITRRLAEQTGERDQAVLRFLDQLKDWDLRYRADLPTYPPAMALAGAMLTPYRRSPLNSRLGGGEGGISHLARLLKEQYGNSSDVPSDPEVQDYLLTWLRTAADNFQQQARSSREIHQMPYQQQGPLQFPALAPEHDLVSPPLSCGQGGTIWSQKGNSYTQIVDLADPDNSRTVLPPGISEDPESPFHADQMDLWARGGTHPAPLTRKKVEEIAVSQTTVTVDQYSTSTPLLLSADGSGRGLAAAHVFRVKPNGSWSYEPVAVFDAGENKHLPVLVDTGSDAESVFLILYGTGIRSRSSLSAVSLRVGDVDAEVLYAGPQGVYEGLDQVNAVLPGVLTGLGKADIVLTVDGEMANIVSIYVR